MTIGIVGLGKMGSRIASKLSKGGHVVHVWNRTPDVATQLAASHPGMTVHKDVSDLLAVLPTPKIVWVMLPSGEATETMLHAIVRQLALQDILINAANSNFHDTDRHAKECAANGIRFLGIGVSGGVIAEHDGYPCMVGGDRSAYETIAPILDTLAVPKGGHTYFGAGGAGHFVKMIHNGIEYGIMQSLAEGFDVMKHSSYGLDLAAVAALWQKGTLVSGFMLDRTADVLARDQALLDVVGKVAESGEARWTIEEAKAEKIPVPIIQASFDYRIQSQTDTTIQHSFTAKLLSAMRNAFGGHAVEKK